MLYGLIVFSCSRHRIPRIRYNAQQNKNLWQTHKAILLCIKFGESSSTLDAVSNKIWLNRRCHNYLKVAPVCVSGPSVFDDEVGLVRTDQSTYHTDPRPGSVPTRVFPDWVGWERVRFPVVWGGVVSVGVSLYVRLSVYIHNEAHIPAALCHYGIWHSRERLIQYVEVDPGIR